MKECKQYNCRRLIQRGTYCDIHIKAQDKYYNKQRSNDKVTAFYRSKEWREQRINALKRDCFMCSRCGDVANLVHHKLEVRVDWDKRLDIDNLESVCRSCHNAIEHYKKYPPM